MEQHGPGVCILRAFIMRLLQDRNVSSSCKLTPKLSMSSHNLLSPRCWGRKEWLGWHGRLEGPDDQEESERAARLLFDLQWKKYNKDTWRTNITHDVLDPVVRVVLQQFNFTRIITGLDHELNLLASSCSTLARTSRAGPTTSYPSGTCAHLASQYGVRASAN